MTALCEIVERRLQLDQGSKEFIGGNFTDLERLTAPHRQLLALISCRKHMIPVGSGLYILGTICVAM